jgi:hypothetical protein
MLFAVCTKRKSACFAGLSAFCASVDLSVVAEALLQVIGDAHDPEHP